MNGSKQVLVNRRIAAVENDKHVETLVILNSILAKRWRSSKIPVGRERGVKFLVLVQEIPRWPIERVESLNS